MLTVTITVGEFIQKNRAWTFEADGWNLEPDSKTHEEFQQKDFVALGKNHPPDSLCLGFFLHCASGVPWRGGF